MVNPDYTVKLEQVFQGPMDLLLHLVREQEVEIHEIEITRVIDGYLAYLKDLEQFDIELASEFVVMAATLMAIKSRSLLPREEVNLEEELDPRDELIQRLIEYRHFKEASHQLAECFDARAKLHPHGFRAPEADEPTLDLSEISHWDLLSAFSRLMRETLAHRAMKITADERPLRYYVERLVARVKGERQLSLRSLVESGGAEEEPSRQLLIGTFCALLELMKLGVVRAFQADGRGDITIALREDQSADIDDIVRLSGFDDEAEERAPAAPPAAEGSERSEDGGGDGGGELEPPDDEARAGIEPEQAAL